MERKLIDAEEISRVRSGELRGFEAERGGRREVEEGLGV